MDVDALDARHPEYSEYCDAWKDIELLANGGCAITRHADRFLMKRPKELPEVYQARLNAFTYQNILGMGLAWYKAALFGEDPDIEGADEAFLENCNRAGKTFIDFFRDVLMDIMQFRTAYVLTDLPKSDVVPVSKADQDALGLLSPYVVRYSPRQVINWERDEYGNLLWIVISTATEQRTFGGKPKVLDRWYFFDRAQYAIYESGRKENQKAGEKREAVLVDNGPHALARVGRVPVRCLELPIDLWLANRAYPQAKDHLNQDNSLAWALFMANLPVPVIKGEFDSELKASETAFIHLPEGGEFSFAEPSGTSFEYSGKRIASLREELCRQMYLQAQGRSTEATPAAQSGYSKEQDFRVSVDIQNAFGDILRAGMTNVLIDVRDAGNGGETKVSVRGFQFDDDDAADEIKTVSAARDLGIQSDTLDKLLQKRVARSLTPDEPEKTHEIIDLEIDAAPTKTQLEENEKKEQAEMIRGGLMRAAGMPRAA